MYDYDIIEVADCNCIVTRGEVYDEILPEPEGNPEGGAGGQSLRAEPKGFPEGSGNISSYTPTRVTIQSFPIT